MANITVELLNQSLATVDGVTIETRRPKAMVPPEQLTNPTAGQLWPRGDKNIYV